ELAGDQMADDLGVHFTLEGPPFADQLIAKRLEILDDSIVHQGNRTHDMRVRVPDRRRPVRRPSRVRNSRDPAQRMLGKLAGEIFELALGPASLELAVLDRTDAGRVIAAIFKALQAVEQPLRDVALSDYADNPAHCLTPPPCESSARGSGEPSRR